MDRHTVNAQQRPQLAPSWNPSLDSEMLDQFGAAKSASILAESPASDPGHETLLQLL
jgi:hypothetical protein